MKSTVEKLKIIANNGKFFRGGVKKVKNGKNFVIQLRDIVENQRSSRLDMSKVVSANVVSRVPVTFLEKGDVLVTVKRLHKKALHLKEVPSKTVATQHFLILRSPNKQKIMPEFIEYVVNSEESQRWFYRKCGGSYESTLNKETLSQLPFPDIPIEEQRKIVTLINEAHEEKRLLLDLIDNRQQQIKAFASKLIMADR